MKSIITTIVGLMLCGSMYAQLPRWAITPSYDGIAVAVDDRVLLTDSLGTTTLWTKDGRRLYTTDNYIHPFKEGVAVITKKDSKDIVGIVDINGKFLALPNLKVTYGHPSFENGYLLCSDAKGYVYYKKDGTRAKLEPSARPYPFKSGYAPYMSYEQLEKQKNPYYSYYRADDENMVCKMMDKGEEKYIDPYDISFLSAIGSDNRGVAVIKNKLYLYNPESELFEPFEYGDDKSEKKRHLTLNGDYKKYFEDLPSDTIEIIAKYGKNLLAMLQFDKELNPFRFVFDGEEKIFKPAAPVAFRYISDLKPYGEAGNFGLASKSGEVVPKQFEEVGLVYDNKAFVKHHGKWGVIEIAPDLSYTIKINKGEDVAFRHQKFDTQIRLDLPARISSKDARIDIPESSGCVIDKTSRDNKDTESGNYVVYDCSLNIPESLPDTMSTITYAPISISYDDIRLFDTSKDIKAWHLKYFNVDPIESETSISNGVATFTININAQKNVGENDYPFDVKIEADSVSVQYEKISETRYKCMVSNLQEGNNNLNILVTEKGCPPSIFPFEVYYTRPVPKKKKQEAVVVRKKSPAVSRPAARIEL